MIPQVAYVLESTAGGSKRHVVDALHGLTAIGYRPLLFYSLRRSDDAFPRQLRSLQATGVIGVPIDMARNPIAPVNLLACRAIAADLARRAGRGRWVVHGHSSIGGMAARGAALLLRRHHRIPAVAIYTPHCPITMATTTATSVRLGFALAERIMARTTAAIVAVGEDERNHMLQNFAGSTPLVRIANGISVSTSTVRRDPGLLAFVGRLCPQKDPLHALEILAHLPPRYRMEIAGDGELRAEVEHRTAQPDIAGRVKLLGHVDPAPLYARAAILLMTSRYEALPYTALEAMSAGCAVAGVASPGLRDLLGETANLTLSERDPAAAAAAIAAHDDCGNLRCMELRNPSIIARRYMISQMIRKLDCLYRVATG